MATTDEGLTLEDTDRVSGRAALVGNVKAALAVSGAVRSTLGPLGMDKMLIDDDGNTVITNDGDSVGNGKSGTPHCSVSHRNE